MEFEYSSGKIKFSRELSDIDRFVIDFVNILNSLKIKYVIVSGYVAILFGRARGTEDIDLFINDIDKNLFDRFVDEIEQKNLWIINTSSGTGAYEMLKDGDSIRIAKKQTAIPNIEMKIAKEKSDISQLNQTLQVVINGSGLLISPIEIQIAFKLWLGSEKDIEDAVYLYELFKEKLDKQLLLDKCKELNVLEVMNKYVK